MPRLCLLAALALLPIEARCAGVDLPGGRHVERVDFERHVMGLLSKTGCNNGSCHGSFQGKNGFRLSLFGYEPAKDHAWLTREVTGRRIDPIRPDESLFLRKAAGLERHEGGVRFSADSWQYKVLREWIAGGAPRNAGGGEVVDLKVEPGEYLRLKAGETASLKAVALFADGTKEDVAPFADFRTQDESVALIDAFGTVKAVRPGDAGIVVSYRGTVRSLRVLVPSPVAADFQYPKLPSTGFIDDEVNAKLKLLDVVPSGPATDAEFLRRLWIDATGTLPSPAQVREFLADSSPHKRTKAIDAALAHPLHAAVWANAMCDITGNDTVALENPQQTKPLRSQLWHAWFRKRFADNMAYDKIAEGVLTATTRDGLGVDEFVAQAKKQRDEYMAKGFAGYADKPTLDLFWRRQGNIAPEVWGEKVAAAFLGVRLECAQCHKHPTDRWTQADYRGWANFFTQIQFATNGKTYSSPEVAKAFAPLNEALIEEAKAATAGKGNFNAGNVETYREMFVAARPRGVLAHPDTNKPLAPKLLGGPEVGPAPDATPAPTPGKKGPRLEPNAGPAPDLRPKIMAWMREPGNPFFAKAFVNRVWAKYFGVGLVNPADDFSLANPPSNARLLEKLASEFVASGFDVRKLERQILTSYAYGRSPVPSESNTFDKNNFARSYVRPMAAEQFIDCLNAALGTQEQFGPLLPKNVNLVEIGASRLGNGNLDYALRVFGRPARTTACDCERVSEPALPQTLYRMTDAGVMQKLRDPAGRIMKFVKAKTPDAEAFEELMLAALSRLPTESEREVFERHAAKEKNKLNLLVDTAWALINTREFVLNR